MNGIGTCVAAAGLIWALQLSSTLVSPQDARYVELHEFTSPITENRFFAPVLVSNPPVASQDYDRCPHPPINTFAYTLVIDPETGYVAYPENFNAAAPWTREEISEIIGTPRFHRQGPEELPWANAHPWEKLENAAKLAQAIGSSSQEIAGWFTMAAWSVRLDVISGGSPFENDVQRMLAAMPQRRPVDSDLITPRELQLARWWEELQRSGQLPDIPAVEADLAIAWLLRSRGELRDARLWLERAALDDTSLAAEPYSLYTYLMESIELEADYLRQARQWLLGAWQQGQIPATQRSSAAVLLGEIARRLGEFEQALYWYGQARETNLGLPSLQLIEHLSSLVEPAAPGAEERDETDPAD